MKIALISDVHGNLEALSAVRQSLKIEGADIVLFLGDIVGYGANPNECLEIVRELSDEILAGNHDWAATGKSSSQNFNPAAKFAIEWTERQLPAEAQSFLSGLPLTGRSEGFMYVHATPEHPEQWHYVFTPADAAECFHTFKEPICFIGHSHYPVVYVRTASGATGTADPGHVEIKKDLRYIINSGSVGQPRDGNPLASYGILDAGRREYRLVRVEYEIRQAQQKIIAAGLSTHLAERLARGR